MEIVPVVSPYDTLKKELKQHMIEFCELYPLSSKENIDAYIDWLLRKNYGRIK